jgi:hypothetical protein
LKLAPFASQAQHPRGERLFGFDNDDQSAELLEQAHDSRIDTDESLFSRPRLEQAPLWLPRAKSRAARLRSRRGQRRWWRQFLRSRAQIGVAFRHPIVFAILLIGGSDVDLATLTAARVNSIPEAMVARHLQRVAWSGALESPATNL